MPKTFIQSSRLPHWVNIGLFVLTLTLNLNIPFSPDDWKNLTDPYDYLSQSKIPVLDKQFFFPPKVAGYDARPFTVPLFYKLCVRNPRTIVQMQMLVLSLSTFLLIAALLLFLEKTSAQYVMIISIYLLTGWWNILGWSVLLLSESLSTSFLFLWLASLLFLYKKPGWLRWVLHASITILFAFTRDSWPYMLLAFYCGICLLWLLFKQPGLKKYAALLVLSIIIFGVQQAGTKAGLRYRLPVTNSIVLRVLPNKAYTAWFINNGMPCAEKLQQNFGPPNAQAIAEDSAYQLWALYTDTAYQPFLNWVNKNGQAVYTRFLLTHPAYFFLTGETPGQLSRIMSYNLFYIDEPRGYSIRIEPLFPLFNIPVLTFLCVVLIIACYRRRRPILLAPVILFLFTLLNALLSYNADALEVSRHLFITNILVQLTGLWAIVLIWDVIPITVSNANRM